LLFPLDAGWRDGYGQLPMRNAPHHPAAVGGRLALAAVSLVLLANALSAASTNFFFVQISDTHLGVRDHDARIERVVDAINALPVPVDFVVLTGDVGSDNLARTNAVRRGLATLRRLKPPLHILPGNHDIQPGRLEGTLGAYTNLVGGLCTVADYRGVRFLLMYTEPLCKPVAVKNYVPLRWLETELRRANGMPVIVCHHRPEVEDLYDGKMHPGWKQDIRDEWVRTLNSANVKAVLAGHFHRDELHWAGNVPEFVCEPVAGYWGRTGAFRLYEYRDGRLSYRTQYLETKD